MKGSEIARDFFFSWGRSFLTAQFPNLADRVAAGRILGSDVLGGDDEISRDHDWGPQFDLFLSADDYAAFDEELSRAMNAAAPNPWKGHRLAGAGDKSVRLESVPGWFHKYLTLARFPRDVADWPPPSVESALYFLRHGEIWMDGTGELGRWRSALHEYPEKILRTRLAEECFRIWQHGEYNFVQRLAHRRDPITISVCLGEFVSGVMRIVLLMSRDFTPYWKWLAFEFRKRPEAQAYVKMLDDLVSVRLIQRQVEIVQSVCALIHRQLLEGGWVTGKGGNPYLLPLLNDKLELENPDRGRRHMRGMPKGAE
ncbi:MAG TPA: DUF4037 domain-containing protein [Tepidisphaeraceae bacterium]|jgi:hypothetical protein|nr:DUF4037 domain-containing protein [Tepidisphaeraceae bacterium]